MNDVVHRVAGPDLSASELYGLLRLRVDVFVVEQRCPYAELDGRDLEPGTCTSGRESSRPRTCGC